MSNRPRPGILAVRAINQYRSRDVLAYLGLRYYFAASAARSDQWVRDVAPHLTVTRTSSSYFEAHHFKELDQSGITHQRSIFLPTPNEILAETALLHECSRHPSIFTNPPCVFSYDLTTGQDRYGVFQPYFRGLQRRQAEIGRACETQPDATVHYIDIQKFYPSISTSLALGAWQKHAQQAKLGSKWIELGEFLIDAHGREGLAKQGSILTGPMFSHLLANLVLRKLDAGISKNFRCKYFRYVDDITLVGDQTEVTDALDGITSMLEEMGLALHSKDSPKTLTVSAGEWLHARNDFRESRRPVSWMTLIADLKRYLLSNPGGAEALDRRLSNEGFRLPIPDYTEMTYEASYIERFRELAENTWFRKFIRQITPESIVHQARYLRKAFKNDFLTLGEELDTADQFHRKRLIPKLRYRASRLVYLAPDEDLSNLALLVSDIPELYFHSAVLRAVGNGNVDELLSLGANAVQAASQPLRSSKKVVDIEQQLTTVTQRQGFSTLKFNGVWVRADAALNTDDELVDFALNGATPRTMSSESQFIGEIASLHGISTTPRHPHVLETAFDQDEKLTLDAIDQLQVSASE